MSAGRPPVALSVSPAAVELAAAGSRALELRNAGAERVFVNVGWKAVGRRTAATSWLRVIPTRLLLRSGTKGIFTLRVRPPPNAQPGDHHVLVFLTARPPRGRRVAVRVRLGVLVRVRVPGRIVRRLELRRLRVHRARGARLLFLSIANRGNVTEQLRGRFTVSLIRRGHMVARLRPRALRELLPGARDIVELRYRGRLRGPVTALVKVRLRLDRFLERRYRIRL